MKIKKFLTILMAVLLVALFCLPSYVSYVYALEEEIIEKELDLDKNGKVYIKNISGNIAVQGWHHNSVLVTARKVAQEKDDLENVTVDISRTNGTVRIITNYRSGIRYRSANVSVHYELSIPSKAALEVETVSGNVEAEKIGGYSNVTSVSGNISVADAEEGADTKSVSGKVRIIDALRKARAKTVSGSVYLENISGEAEGKTVSGDIVMRNIMGSVSAENISGRIELAAVAKSESVEAKTISGKVVYEGELERSGSYQVNSHSGNILLRLPKGSHFEIKAKTLSGRTRSDFDLSLTDKLTKKEMRGVVGKGGASLKVSSFSGNIEIRQQ